MTANTLQWLLESGEPWTRYRTLLDFLDWPEDDPEVLAARAGMLAHPQVQSLMAATATWGDRPLKRHNDAGHTVYAFSTLADFGVRAADAPPGSALFSGTEAVVAHRSREGAFQTLVNIPKHFGGTGEDMWTWMACDAPTLLYAMLAFGLDGDPRVQRAVEHLYGLVEDNGWRCRASDDLAGKFKGPGRRSDPCPIANVYALKALSLVPGALDSPATRIGTETLLSHWENQGRRKLFLFGIGTDFRKLKYPYVWYDALHVAEVLSRFPFVVADRRFREMIEAITVQADAEGRYTATSMYMAWRGWSFADKKSPSPWLTFLVMRLLKRAGRLEQA